MYLILGMIAILSGFGSMMLWMTSSRTDMNSITYPYYAGFGTVFFFACAMLFFYFHFRSTARKQDNLDETV